MQGITSLSKGCYGLCFSTMLLHNHGSNSSMGRSRLDVMGQVACTSGSPKAHLLNARLHIYGFFVVQLKTGTVRIFSETKGTYPIFLGAFSYAIRKCGGKILHDFASEKEDPSTMRRTLQKETSQFMVGLVLDLQDDLLIYFGL